MLSFQDFLKMKQQGIMGTDVRKTEYAACRAIITTVKENIKFVQNEQLKQLLEQMMEILMKKGKK